MQRAATSDASSPRAETTKNETRPPSVHAPAADCASCHRPLSAGRTSTDRVPHCGSHVTKSDSPLIGPRSCSRSLSHSSLRLVARAAPYTLRRMRVGKAHARPHMPPPPRWTLSLSIGLAHTTRAQQCVLGRDRNTEVTVALPKERSPALVPGP